MKFCQLCLFASSFTLGFTQEENQSNSSQTPAVVNADLFDSSFFSGVLDQPGLGDDAMGTQRLVDQRSTSFSPSIIFSTNYNYNSNPLAAADNAKVWEDGFLTSFNLGFNLGLGEYALGEEVLLTPSLYLSHSRTYYDLVKDNGGSSKYLDADSQVASLSFPFVLPKDFVFRISHTYFRPIDFRNDKSDIYIHSPSFALEKQIPLPTGGILNTFVGAGFSITEGKEYLASLISAGVDPNAAQLLYTNLELQGQDPAVTRPTNLQDSWNHQIALNYMHPISEKLLAISSFSYSNSVYTEGRYVGREDTVTNFGLNFNYALFEWLNFSALSNYSIKNTNEKGKAQDIVDYKNLIGGVAFGINYAF